MKLSELLQMTHGSFRSISLRSITFQDSEKQLCLFLKIRFNIEDTVENLFDPYNKYLNAKGVTNTRIFESNLEIEHFESLVNEINDGAIAIDGVKYSLPSIPTSIADVELVRIENYLNKDNLTHYVIRTTLENRSPLQHLNQLNKGFAINWLDLNTLLNVDLANNYHI
ncbi:MAG: hypothetical protein L0H53_16855, partial [Candidatus Nitrosocosmicus sp.]|nr:hypothetical protein [Candidatus Nitrosocosmicus sp.]